MLVYKDSALEISQRTFLFHIDFPIKFVLIFIIIYYILNDTSTEFLLYYIINGTKRNLMTFLEREKDKRGVAHKVVNECHSVINNFFFFGV